MGARLQDLVELGHLVLPGEGVVGPVVQAVALVGDARVDRDAHAQGSHSQGLVEALRHAGDDHEVVPVVTHQTVEVLAQDGHDLGLVLLGHGLDAPRTGAHDAVAHVDRVGPVRDVLLGGHVGLLSVVAVHTLGQLTPECTGDGAVTLGSLGLTHAGHDGLLLSAQGVEHTPGGGHVTTVGVVVQRLALLSHGVVLLAQVVGVAAHLDGAAGVDITGAGVSLLGHRCALHSPYLPVRSGVCAMIRQCVWLRMWVGLVGDGLQVGEPHMGSLDREVVVHLGAVVLHLHGGGGQVGLCQPLQALVDEHQPVGNGTLHERGEHVH